MIITSSVTQVMAAAQSNATNDARTDRNSTSGIITEQKAIMIAQQHFKGRVLAITHPDNVYRIKILSEQGTIHIVLINATDGTVISAHWDNADQTTPIE